MGSALSVQNWVALAQQGQTCSLQVQVPYPASKTAHRATRGRVWGSPSFSCSLSRWQSCQLPLQVVVDGFVYWQNRVEQRPVSCGPVQCPYGGGQGFDEMLILQLGYVLPHCVGAHACAFPDFPKARVTQVRLPILAKQQVSVHSDFSCAQSQGENLVGQKKKSSLPWLSLASPSHIFSASLLPCFQIWFCEAFSLFYAAKLLRKGAPPLFPICKRPGLLPTLA